MSTSVSLDPARPTEQQLDAELTPRSRAGTLASSFVAGAMFAVGLALAGMTRPEKVLAFLSFTHRWEPTLAFVMGGAILVHAPLYRLVRKRGLPFFSTRFFVTARNEIDARLLGGAALFGVGWGLGGFCPGPAIVALVSLSPAAWVFVAAMGAGILLGARLDGRPRHASQ